MVRILLIYVPLLRYIFLITLVRLQFDRQPSHLIFYLEIHLARVTIGQDKQVVYYHLSQLILDLK